MPEKSCSSFTRGRQGNVALMFGILLPAMVVAAGIGIDFYRATNTRAALQEATDAGVLAAGRAKMADSSLTLKAAEKIARKYFDRNFSEVKDFKVKSFVLSENPKTGTYLLNATGDKSTTLMSIVGQKYMKVTATSEIRRGAARALEVALALDVTGSMSGSKIDDLKAAAKDLIEALTVDPSADVKISVVPFARHVNVGIDKIGAKWLKTPPDSTWDSQSCSVDVAAATAKGCSASSSTCYDDGVPYACEEWSCPDGNPAPTNCTTTTYKTSFLGCVGSRNYPRNIKDSDYNLEQVPGVDNAVPWPDCPKPLTPLTDDKKVVTQAIDDLVAGGETYIPGGLSWGFRTLTEGEPFTGGMSFADMKSKGGLKVLVLMTDGDNTASPDWGAHYGSDKALADQYTEELCDEVKANDVAIYTIAFQVSDLATKKLLESCATKPPYYFDAANGSELTEAFEEIGASLGELALVK